MTTVLVLLSFIMVVIGGLMLTPATTGVGVVCIGIAFGVWARINQASNHRRADEKIAKGTAEPARPKAPD